MEIYYKYFAMNEDQKESKIRELLLRIKRLEEENKNYKERKTYGLVWENEKIKEKIVEDCKNKLPILERVKEKEIITDKEKPTNIMIEGDNYHALSCLNYTHRNSVDVIYIDPPYNTGNKDFKYNDKFIDKEDEYRHSKWLNFMEKRLDLAKYLLKDDGVIFISIDDNEIAQLKLLCDEIFNENNLLGVITVAKGTTTGQDAKKFGSSVDYILCYCKENFVLGKLDLSDEDKKRFSRKDEKGNYSILQWRKTGNGDKRGDRPNLFYPLKAPDGSVVYPVGPTGYESRWRGNEKNYNSYLKQNMVEWIKQNNEWKPYIKYYLENRLKSASNLWDEIDGNKKATIELKDIFGEKNFLNPKPTDLIKKCISLNCNFSSLILDFFAGSGTTGQAVLDLNKEDGGNRKFILCTNNEGNIATEVCYPRIEKVIKGYKKNGNGEFVEGLGGNLEYFKADENSFISIDTLKKVSDPKKLELTYKAGELIAIKEDIFDEVDKNEYWQIFEDDKRQVAIYFTEDQQELRKLLEKLDIKKEKIVYLFNWGKNTASGEDFGYPDITIKDIPQPIINIYQEING